MEKNANVINWFEIPVTDLTRAKKFYETIMDITMSENRMGPLNMGFFPYEMGSGKLSGALVEGEGYKPSSEGALIYLNCNPDLSLALNKIENAGGKTLLPKTEIGPGLGFMAFFLDTEGNKVGLHSNK
ncbi:MAG TPA: VOC family protein [Bacteroidia bacterium]|jgi:hypothetical protein